MKFIAKKYQVQSVEIGQLEIELDEQNPTYLMGRSGGDAYVCAIIPVLADVYNEDRTAVIGKQLDHFVFISSNKTRESRVKITRHQILDWNRSTSILKHTVHYEDILAFLESNEESIYCERTTKENFYTKLAHWRII